VRTCDRRDAVQAENARGGGGCHARKSPPSSRFTHQVPLCESLFAARVGARHEVRLVGQLGRIPLAGGHHVPVQAAVADKVGAGTGQAVGGGEGIQAHGTLVGLGGGDVEAPPQLAVQVLLAGTHRQYDLGEDRGGCMRVSRGAHLQRYACVHGTYTRANVCVCVCENVFVYVGV